MSKIKNLRIILLLLPLLFILFSCSKSPLDDEETSINVDEEVDGNDDSSNESSDDDTDIGYTHSVGVDSEVPEEFPIEDLPIPKGATVTQAQNTAIDSNARIIIIYQYNGDVDQLVEMYRDNFENGGFDEVNDATEAQNEYGGGTALKIEAKKDENTYIVEIGTGGEPEVTLLYNAWK